MKTTDEATYLEDCIPALATAHSDEEDVAALLAVIADPSLVEGHEDVDLVLDASLVALLDYDELPDRTIDVLLTILAAEEDDDVTLVKKMAACDVLASMNERASAAIPVLVDLLPLDESDRDFERWLALRAARAIWNISGDPQPAAEVARKLAEDEQEWLTIHAENLLGMSRPTSGL